MEPKSSLGKTSDALRRDPTKVLLPLILLFLTGCLPTFQDSDRHDRATEELIEAVAAAQQENGSQTLEICLELLEQARALKSSTAEIHALQCVAFREYLSSELASAWRRHERSASLAEAIGSQDLLVGILINQAVILRRWELNDEALDLYLEISRREDVRESPRYFGILNNIASLEMRRGNFKEPLQLIERGLSSADPESFVSEILACNKGRALVGLARFEEALAYLDEIRLRVEESADATLLSSHSKFRGSALVGLGRYLEASTAFEQATAHARDAGSEFFAVPALLELAAVSSQLGLDAKALEQLTEVIRIADTIGASRETVDAHWALSELFTKGKNFERALTHLETAVELREQLTNEQSEKRLDGLQVLFNVQLLEKDLESSRQIEQTQRYLLWVSALALVLVSATLVLLVRRYRAEARLAARIRSDHEELQALNKDLVEAGWRELEQVRRTTTLGEMAAAFAHELRQPLTAIFTNAQATQRMLPPSEGPSSMVGGAVEDIVESARRAQEIVKRLRRLMGHGEIRMKRIDLNAVVREIEDLLHKEAEKTASAIRLDLAAGPLMVQGDRVHLQQVVLNLVQNGLAVAATSKESSPLEIRTRMSDDGRKVILEVEDQGPPVSDEVMARMFEPLFSSKAEGMGMGLALCRTIAEAHDGTLSARRNEERGLTLSLALSLAPSLDS